MYQELPGENAEEDWGRICKQLGWSDDFSSQEWVEAASSATTWSVLSPNPWGWDWPVFPASMARPSGTVVYTRSPDTDPDAWDMIERRAMEVGQRGDHEKASQLHGELVRRFPTVAMHHFRYGAALSLSGKIEEGLSECRIAEQLEPDWPLPVVEIAIIYFRAGKLEEALSAIRKAATRFEPDAHLANVYGTILQNADQLAEAVRWYRIVVDQNPQHVQALAGLAHCLLVTGQTQEGRQIAKQAKHAGDPTIYKQLNDGFYK
jgi:tetratricopeptide (TPR) repeat protein